MSIYITFMLVAVLVALALYYYLYDNSESDKEGFRNRGGGRASKVFGLDGSRYGMRGGALPNVGTSIRMPELGNDVFNVTSRKRGHRGKHSGKGKHHDYVVLQPSSGYVYGDYYAPYSNVLWELYPPPYGYDYYPYANQYPPYTNQYQYQYPPASYPSYNVPWWWRWRYSSW